MYLFSFTFRYRLLERKNQQVLALIISFVICQEGDALHSVSHGQAHLHHSQHHLTSQQNQGKLIITLLEIHS